MNAKRADVIPIKKETGLLVRNARVITADGTDIRIRIGEETCEARTAFSCLVRPMPGDLVLTAANDNGTFYILGIIERPGTPDMDLSFPGDVNLNAQKGSCRILSGKSITFGAAETLSCFSDQAIHKSREAVCSVDEITATGNNLQASFKSVRLISGLVNTLARNMIQKARNYIRCTETDDQVAAGQLTRKAQGLYTMDSKYTVMVSQKDTKIDGERIHMG